MNGKWILNTKGHPLARVRDFIDAIWQEANLDGMLAPLNMDGASVSVEVIYDRRDLRLVNPFKPLMTVNAAQYVPEMLASDPGRQFGALLRPCEMRALVEMVKHRRLSLDNLLTISVDCLSTFPADEYAWRAARKSAAQTLTDEALQFARQGGIVPYRYRGACQMCTAPDARQADVNIGVLGMPARRVLLVEARDAQTAHMLDLDLHADGPASEDLIVQRNRVLGKIIARHELAWASTCERLRDILPGDVAQLVERFAACGACQECLDACPICAVDRPERNTDGEYAQDDLCRWLISCTGCGMCEQVCPQHEPLCAIFGVIREQLAQATGYEAGQSMDEPLPVWLLSVEKT